MIRIMEQDPRKFQKQCGTATKFIITENGAMDSDLIPYMPHNLTINELGKQLLKAATEGKVEEIRMLMSKGAPFTADWLGTSPLHLAAQNNHLEVCEILIRAGMSRDARTKVDRTPLHMAVYEGHEEIVECLLKNGADYDCKDLLHMTPLHWAAQNGFAKIATTLIRYGAATHLQNKFNLTPAEIAMQINRPDIVQIINLGIRDPLVAQLALEMISDNTQAAVEPILNLENSNDVDDVDSNDVTPLPIETVMVEDETENSLGLESGNYEEVQEEVSQEEVESIECETNYSDSFKLLQQHGITMLPVDENNILNSVMETGHSVVLTEAGKQALNSIKTNETNEELAEYLKTKTSTINPVRKNKIITVTAEEFLAMTNNGTLTSQPNILKQINGKVINSLQKPLQTKRTVMKKNKVMSISPTVNVMKVPKVDNNLDVESLLEELQKARTLIEYYKEKLAKRDQELSRCKQQIKALQIAAKHNS